MFKLHSYTKVLFFLLLLLIENIFAQNAIINGIVIDSLTNSPLPGANALLTETSIGAASNIDGKFYISSIPPGKYTLRIRYIGYQTKNIKITLKPNQNLHIKIKLRNKAIRLKKDVIVSAQREGQVAAINQQLSSEALVNVVSSEKMLEFPDANVAESVSRLPGVSIIRDGGEGAGLVVRGLSPKFSKVTVDGIDMASTGTNSRSTNLSGISQENLKGIELFKTTTADMDGESVGGTINLQTGKAPDKSIFLIRTYGYYNELEKNLGQYSLFGKYSNRFGDGQWGLQTSFNIESRDRSADFFSGSYELGIADTATGKTPLLITSSSVTDRLENRKRYGGNIILDYNLPNGSLKLSSFLSKTDRNILDRSRQISITNVSGRQIIREADLSLESYVNTLLGEHKFLGMESDWSIAFSYSRKKRPFDHRIQFNENLNLPNINDVPLNQNAVDYYNHVTVDSIAIIDQARYRKENIQERNFIGQFNLKYKFTFSSGISGYLKLGTKYKHINRDKSFQEAQLWAYLYDNWNSLTSKDFIDNNYKPNNFLRGKAGLGMILDAERNKLFYDKYSSNEHYVKSIFYSYRSSVGTGAGIPNYKSKENITAFYIMPKIKYETLLTFIPGLRYEIVDNKYFGNNYYSLVSNSPKPRGTDYFISDTSATQKYSDLLPMIHLKIQPVNWFDIRTSFTKTLSRPNYNWLIPSQSLSNFSGVNIYKGNSKLKPARAYSYDIYASFYEPELGFVSLGYYYKKIDDISVLFNTFVTQEQIKKGIPEFGIEPLKNNQDGFSNLYNGNILRTPINLPESEVKGLELELQTNLQLYPVPDFLKGIVLNFNYSLINSSTYFPWSKTTTKIVTDPYPRVEKTIESGLRKGKVPGQADYLLNLSIGYDYKGFSGRIVMFKQSKSIATISTQKELDTYRNSFTRWDISLKQKIFCYLNIYMNFVNVTNNQDESFQSTSYFSTKIQDYGRAFELGMQIKF
jgi:outer membrane receptor protein involved in Fe transport